LCTSFNTVTKKGSGVFVRFSCAASFTVQRSCLQFYLAKPNNIMVANPGLAGLMVSLKRLPVSVH
jgi:hypothetical protein